MRCLWNVSPKDRHCKYCTALCDERNQKTTVLPNQELCPKCQVKLKGTSRIYWLKCPVCGDVYYTRVYDDGSLALVKSEHGMAILRKEGK